MRQQNYFFDNWQRGKKMKMFNWNEKWKRDGKNGEIYKEWKNLKTKNENWMRMRNERIFTTCNETTSLRSHDILMS